MTPSHRQPQKNVFFIPSEQIRLPGEMKTLLTTMNYRQFDDRVSTKFEKTDFLLVELFLIRASPDRSLALNNPVGTWVHAKQCLCQLTMPPDSSATPRRSFFESYCALIQKFADVFFFRQRNSTNPIPSILPDACPTHGSGTRAHPVREVPLTRAYISSASPDLTQPASPLSSSIFSHPTSRSMRRNSVPSCTGTLKLCA